MFSQKNKNLPIRTAILGHRGIPSSYGGFETLAEELATCLVGLGAGVTVYCRKNYFETHPATYKGASLVYLPTIARKSLDTLFHTVISVFHLILKNTADVVLVVNVGNAPAALLAKIFGKKVIFCVDGLDWERKKWGKFAKWYLRTCSYFAKIVSHQIVTDAASVYEFYKRERGFDSTLIPYGTDIETEIRPDPGILGEYGLQPKKYFLYVARFEPENNPMGVVKAHAESGSELPLVMIGDNRYNPEFVSQIKKAAAKNVIFTGYVFGSRYKELVKNSLASVRAAEVGGLSPVVVEAMGRSVCVIANDKPENREPLGDAGLYFNLKDFGTLAEHFRRLSKNPIEAIELGKKAAQRAMILYSWDTIAYEYFKLIKKVSGAGSSGKNGDNTTGGERKKKILMTGSGGVLGREFQKYFSRHYTVLSTSRQPIDNTQVTLDVTDQASLEKAIADYRPDYIFHLAAMTNLEECEKKLSSAYAINTLSTKHLAKLSAKYGAKLVFISSANVFNGRKESYNETDEPSPINVYGLTKHMGELMAQYYAPHHLIIRLGWVIGGGPLYDKKFVAKIVEQINAGKRELHVVTGKYGNISYAPDVARTLDALIKNGSEGIYHVSSPSPVNRFQIAEQIVSTLGYKDIVKINPVSDEYFSGVYFTPRPDHECMNIARLRAEKIDTIRPWRSAVNDYLRKEFSYAFRSEHDKDMVPRPAIA